MASRRPIIIFDTETSGTDPTKGHEIVEIAAKALNAHDLSDHPAGTFHAFIKPQNPELASSDALYKIGDVWDKAQDEGLEPKVVFNKFIQYVESVNDTNSFMTRPTLCAYNTPFDMRMINYWFEHYGALEIDEKKGELKVPWSILHLDLLNVIYMMFDSDYDMTDFKLDTALERFGYKRKTDKHDALEDVELSANLFRDVLLYLRKCRQRMKVNYE